MNFGIAFAPLVSAPFLWAATAVALILALLLFVSRSRGATIRAIALGLVVLACLPPPSHVLVSIYLLVPAE